MTTALKHTPAAALKKFTLITGAGNGKSTACAASALAWIKGDNDPETGVWSDQMPCAHPVIRANLISANDGGASDAEKRKLVRLGVTGALDTWWVPTEVVLWALMVPKDAETPRQVDRVLAALKSISDWKAADPKDRPSLRDAYLGGANLGGANLRDAYLGGAKYTQGTLFPAGFDPKAAGAIKLP